jgi:hypothetical protein
MVKKIIQNTIFNIRDTIQVGGTHTEEKSLKYYGESVFRPSFETSACQIDDINFTT